MAITTDRNDPGINKPMGEGQQNESYLVLSDEEKAKGFVRQVRTGYQHVGKLQGHVLRDLTTEENGQYGDHFAKFEEYPEGVEGIGRFWKQSEIDSGCGGQLTTMNYSIAETYARDPKFYGSTWCCNCCDHFPVDEFVWDGTTELVGS